MDNKSEGLFQISFFLAMLFFMISMFVVSNLMLMMIFLLISFWFIIITFMTSIAEREKRSTQKKSNSRTIAYL